MSHDSAGIFAAVEEATPEQLMHHPNAWMFALKQRENSFRDSVTVTHNDNRQTVNVLLEDGQLERIKQALRASLDEGRPIELGAEATNG